MTQTDWILMLLLMMVHWLHSSLTLLREQEVHYWWMAHWIVKESSGRMLQVLLRWQASSAVMR